LGGFDTVQHTADVGIRVWGMNWNEVFEEAARGMVSQIVDLKSVFEKEKREFHIEGEDGEELLLKWLREILFLMERGMIFAKFWVGEDNFSSKNPNKYRFHGMLWGEYIDPSRHDICTEVKAITRHGLHLVKKGPWWETFILFDV